jgi:hypothetical protein
LSAQRIAKVTSGQVVQRFRRPDVLSFGGASDVPAAN